MIIGTTRRAAQTPIRAGAFEPGPSPGAVGDGSGVRCLQRAAIDLSARICRGLGIALALTAGIGMAQPASAQPAAAEQALEKAIAAQADAVDEALASQARVEETRRETEAMLAELRNRRRELEGLTRYHDHVERMIAAQTRSIADTEAELATAAVTERELIPLLERMVESLRHFVALDLPFERGVREARVRALAAVIDDPELAAAEKLRRILVAYRAEMDYGRTLAAYRGLLPAARPGPVVPSPDASITPSSPPSAVRPPERLDDAPTVDLLRIGRVALFYRSLDGRRLGLWDQAQGDWVALPARWRQPLAKALRVARKQSAPELLTLPLPAAEDQP
jgi:hypothetical protein